MFDHLEATAVPSEWECDHSFLTPHSGSDNTAVDSASRPLFRRADIWEGRARGIVSTEPRFSDFNFGLAAAEDERAQAPELLLDGYYEVGHHTEEAARGSKFLFLGYKGSGKSAIAERLYLMSQSDPQMFTTIRNLGDFPFTAFKRVVGGENEPEARYPLAWSWILLLNLLDSLSRDEAVRVTNHSRFSTTVAQLRHIGLLPAIDLTQSVLVSSKKTFKATVPTILEASYERAYAEGHDLNMRNLVDLVKNLLVEANTPNRHLLVIDGLDDVLVEGDVQFQSLAALVLEAWRINAEFAGKGLPYKIIVLCRTDLFERLPGANKNKVRQDNAAELDWYHSPNDRGRSELLGLVNLRARLTDPDLRDAMAKYVVPAIGRSGVQSVLLDHTRQTPRDFIQLLRRIQRFTKGEKPTHDEVIAGLRRYSIEYFLPELKDELAGYVPREDADAGFQLMGTLRRRTFTFKELRTEAQGHERFQHLDVANFVEALFECSGIGNLQERQNRSGKTSNVYTFHYRNRNSTINLREKLVLHKGVWKAFNVV